MVVTFQTAAGSAVAGVVNITKPVEVSNRQTTNPAKMDPRMFQEFPTRISTTN
jgi:hypothetical protein